MKTHTFNTALLSLAYKDRSFSPVLHSLKAYTQSKLELLGSVGEDSALYIADTEVNINKSLGKKSVRVILEPNQVDGPLSSSVHSDYQVNDLVELNSDTADKNCSLALQSCSDRDLEPLIRKLELDTYAETVRRFTAQYSSFGNWYGCFIGLGGDALGSYRRIFAYAVSMRPHFLYVHELSGQAGTLENPVQSLSPESDFATAQRIGFWTSLLHCFEDVRQDFYGYRQIQGLSSLEYLQLYEDFGNYLGYHLPLVSEAMSDSSFWESDQWFETLSSAKKYKELIRHHYYTYMNSRIPFSATAGFKLKSAFQWAPRSL